MAKDKDPAFLMYPKDWLSGTAEYMPDEKGVYIDLLCHQHQRKELPGDTKRLAKMVGLSHKEFMRIWVVISCHFEQQDNRLVNRKLQRLMEDREQKGKVNTVIGTFAGLLRLGNYTKEKYIHLKKNFKPTEFVEIPKENLTDRLTEWIVVCLKSIGDGDGDGDENKLINYKGVLKKVLAENEITLPEGFSELILEWLKYKSEKGQTYKETGLKNLIIKIINDSGGNYDAAKNMIFYSVSNNYAGLFKEKANGTGKTIAPATDIEIADILLKHFGDE